MSQRQQPRRAHIDARGRRQERVSEYFNFDDPIDGPEKAQKKVTRIELLAILTQFKKAEEQGRWYRVLWRWLKARRGSGAVHKVEPTQGEIERGEATPA